MFAQPQSNFISTFEDVVVPGEGLVRGEVAVPVGEVEEAEGEREEDAGGRVDPGGAVRRALPRRLDLPLPPVALNKCATRSCCPQMIS